MSRKSARILGKKRKSLADEEEIVTAFSRKRHAPEAEPIAEEADCSERNSEVHRRLAQFQKQNQWVPISHTGATTTTTAVTTVATLTCASRDATGRTTAVTAPSDPDAADIAARVHALNTTPQDEVLTGCAFRLPPHLTAPLPLRLSPLPCLEWADSREVWQLMMHKERLYTHDQHMFSRHPALQKRMRTVLLDWLIEVCEVYRLHRETFYLATEFIDRYLSLCRGLQKQQLQLIGVAALFVAAKLEEVYPPKLCEFAYVTDGACTENEILHQELIILKTLKWDLAPMTVNSWLNIYLQLVNVEKLEDSEHNFVFPQYSAHSFVQIMRLLDLCLLDVDCLQFAYSVLAAAALYHMSSQHVALSVSGFHWSDIAPCVCWMSAYAMTLREAGPTDLKFFDNILADDTHNIQTHCVDLTMLERSAERLEQLRAERTSPQLTRPYSAIITPPASSKGKGERPDRGGARRGVSPDPLSGSPLQQV